jgi:hypothetical protein
VACCAGWVTPPPASRIGALHIPCGLLLHTIEVGEGVAKRSVQAGRREVGRGGGWPQPVTSRPPGTSRQAAVRAACYYLSSVICMSSSGTMRLISMRNNSNAASKITLLVRGCKFLGRGNAAVVNATHGSALVRRSLGPVVSCPLVRSSTTASIQPNSRWYSAGSGSSSSKGEVSSNESATPSPPSSFPPEDNDETVMITIEEPQKPAPDSPITVDLDRSKFTHEVKFKLPDMEGDGRVRKWFKKEGDIIQRKDILCEIELEVGIITVAP